MNWHLYIYDKKSWVLVEKGLVYDIATAKAATLQQEGFPTIVSNGPRSGT